MIERFQADRNRSAGSIIALDKSESPIHAPTVCSVGTIGL